ncbi:hypothetical protein EK904_000489, partial [Melospiza melodia maxima]
MGCIQEPPLGSRALLCLPWELLGWSSPPCWVCPYPFWDILPLAILCSADFWEELLDFRKSLISCAKAPSHGSCVEEAMLHGSCWRQTQPILGSCGKKERREHCSWKLAFSLEPFALQSEPQVVDAERDGKGAGSALQGAAKGLEIPNSQGLGQFLALLSGIIISLQFLGSDISHLTFPLLWENGSVAKAWQELPLLLSSPILPQPGLPTPSHFSLLPEEQALTLVFLWIPLPCFPSWALCSSNGSESEVPAGMAKACPAGISTFGKFVCRGVLAGVFPRTLSHPLGPHSFPGISPALGGGKVASPAAPPSHLSLHKSREYSRAPVLALCGIPIGTGISGDGLCLPVWNVEPCEPFSFGSASLEKPFLPVTCVPS